MVGAASISCSFCTLTFPAKVKRDNRFGCGDGICQRKYGQCQSTEGLGNLQMVISTSTHGSEAELYLFGGCDTSWKVANKGLLFVRPDAVFNGQKPISAGIPHCFPQFGPDPLQQHGLLGTLTGQLLNQKAWKGIPLLPWS